MTIEVIYNNRDNIIELGLKNGGVDLTDYSAISRIVLILNPNTSIDSTIKPEYFDWTGTKIILKLGQAGINTGQYFGVRFITYDPDNPNGLVWADDLRLLVK